MTTLEELQGKLIRSWRRWSTVRGSISALRRWPANSTPSPPQRLRAANRLPVGTTAAGLMPAILCGWVAPTPTGD